MGRAIPHPPGPGHGDDPPCRLRPYRKPRHTALHQVAAALGRPPTLWYWGHLHNAIVYQNMFDGPTTKGRVCGHGAIPFGNAWGLEDSGGNTITSILYYAHTPDPALPRHEWPVPREPARPQRYALVTLHCDGGFSESFYETGVEESVWQRSWSAVGLEGG